MSLGIELFVYSEWDFYLGIEVVLASRVCFEEFSCISFFRFFE